MEFIYLAIGNYKNIYNQGFNFSSKFDCEIIFTSKNDLTEVSLSIRKKQNQIINFFGENIDVTAIVGKNGTGKSTLLNILENDRKLNNSKYFIVYKIEEQYYCEFNQMKPSIYFEHKIEYKSRNEHDYENSFMPKIIRLAHDVLIGKDELSHYYFGKYTGLYGGSNIYRQNSYNMLDARFFVPRYINIVTDNIDFFEKIKEMYEFDTLRLILKNNSTVYIKKLIDNEIKTFGYSTTSFSKKVCVYEKTEEILKKLEKKLSCPIHEIEIHLYDRNREKIIQILEKIEHLYRLQSPDNQIKNFNKYNEFDLAIFIAFSEYALNNTPLCESLEMIYITLVEYEEIIRKNALKKENIFRIQQSIILDFFYTLEERGLQFTKEGTLSIQQIIDAIKYIQQFNVINFDEEGSPYFEIPIDKKLKENLPHIQIFQKIFFEHEFDCGKEIYLRVFEYDLINNKIGSSYNTISEGERHFIRLGIDLVYYLQTLKNYNFTPEKESIALLLVDEPDNAMHPTWKKKVFNYVIEILNNYSDIPNIKKHFIFSTHSPFLLSDIPKNNIIFLDKVDETTNINYLNLNIDILKNGMCINVSEFIDIDTFGANIHTLLTHGFFMSEGLLGDFAKNKIDDIKKFYEEVQNSNNSNKIHIEELKEKFNKSKIEFEYIQQIIGEPFLQTIVKNYLDELKQSFDVETYKNKNKNKILEQFSQEELEEYLEKLKNA